MASGFLILQDGRCLAVRSSLHDAVLRAVAAEPTVDARLRDWLHLQVPRPGEPDLGYAFVRPDGDIVPRFLDLRGLTPGNWNHFVAAARRCQPVEGNYAPLGDVTTCLHRLRAMLDACERGDPPLALSDWRDVAPPCERGIAPGWDEPA